MKAAPKKVFWSGVDHHNYRTEKLYPGYWDADQLYHLDSDLYEQNNLINSFENKQKVSEMKALLRSYVSDLPHAFGEFSEKMNWLKSNIMTVRAVKIKLLLIIFIIGVYKQAMHKIKSNQIY